MIDRKTGKMASIVWKHPDKTNRKNKIKLGTRTEKEKEINGNWVK